MASFLGISNAMLTFIWSTRSAVITKNDLARWFFSRHIHVKGKASTIALFISCTSISKKGKKRMDSELKDGANIQLSGGTINAN